MVIDADIIRSTPTERADDLGRRIAAFTTDDLFTGAPEVLHPPNPYRRMLMPDAVAEVDFTHPLGAAEAIGHSALVAHRLLGTFYESDTVLLPEQGLGELRGDFDRFYGDGLRRLREASLSDLERFAFGLLDDEIDVTGAWSVDDLAAYFEHAAGEADAGEAESLTAIAAARQPAVAADTYLVQLALDGLTEASAMSKNLGGAFGPEQSALFKIFIDEFGYGVHEAKHTTIFRKMLRSRAMQSHVHAYWNFYLAGPLATNNYYYFVSRDHANFFRYIGAVTYAERVFAPSFVKMIETYRAVFGDDVDLHYCEEHAHIDAHHGRITRDEVLLSLAERHGGGVIPALVRGIAEARLLGAWFEADTAAQIRWVDDLDAYRALGVGTATLPEAAHRRELTAASPFGTRSHDRTMVVVVEDGDAELITGPTAVAEPMTRGDAVLVPAGRLYGVRAAGPSCAYSVRVAETDLRMTGADSRAVIPSAS
jgi:Iron-containing redox enzyme